jgi:hypothetical protein
MSTFKLLTIWACSLALGGMVGDAWSQDELAAATRGTVKVQLRVFNPFEIGQSRLTLNPFGVFTVQQPSVVSGRTTSPSASSSTAAVSTTSTSSSLEVAQSSTIGDSGDTIATSSVRPPFRPPTRSPWRPPPRLPFFPP